MISSLVRPNRVRIHRPSLLNPVEDTSPEVLESMEVAANIYDKEC